MASNTEKELTKLLKGLADRSVDGKRNHYSCLMFRTKPWSDREEVEMSFRTGEDVENAMRIIKTHFGRDKIDALVSYRPFHEGAQTRRTMPFIVLLKGDIATELDNFCRDKNIDTSS